MTSALNVHEQQLGELIGNFNTFFAAFAAQSATAQNDGRRAAGGAWRDQQRVSRRSTPPSRPTRDIRPRHPPRRRARRRATVTAALPWIEQVQASLAPSELGGVAKGLDAAAPALANLEGEQMPLFQQTDLFNKCLTKA